mgnify:CR=1 FL=1
MSPEVLFRLDLVFVEVNKTIGNNNARELEKVRLQIAISEMSKKDEFAKIVGSVDDKPFTLNLTK